LYEGVVPHSVATDADADSTGASSGCEDGQAQPRFSNLCHQSLRLLSESCMMSISGITVRLRYLTGVVSDHQFTADDKVSSELTESHPAMRQKSI
jgi:hypothetical protein